LSNGKLLVYNDTRKFGIVTVLRESEIAEFKFFKKLGLEPLSKEFNAKALYEIFQARNKSVKSVIMDASIIVGVGNIYACESLFSAGISPLRIANQVTKNEAAKLYTAIVDTLERAIVAGGSTISDYAKADGEAGYFQHNFLVYDREGQPCKKCKGKILRIKQNGRSSYYCGKCQS
jgi:formamidopyrimidine-DNA glycosylase